MRGKAMGLIVWIACATSAHAQQPRSPWVGASGGAIPEGAVAYGQEADGREQFVCRGAQGGGIHLGKIASGFAGCNIGYGGREITLPDYEVLVGARSRGNIAEELLSAAVTARSDRMRSRRAAEASSPSEAPPPQTSASRHFDEDGQPYVEETLPDGTIKQTYEGGVWLIKPDGTKTYKGIAWSHAPMPTPPELPEDPKLGRAWMERHNLALLDMIRTLVNNDAAEMKKFAEAEQKAKDDGLFGQIAHRTQVASFLAQQR